MWHHNTSQPPRSPWPPHGAAPAQLLPQPWAQRSARPMETQRQPRAPLQCLILAAAKRGCCAWDRVESFLFNSCRSSIISQSCCSLGALTETLQHWQRRTPTPPQPPGTSLLCSQVGKGLENSSDLRGIHNRMKPGRFWYCVWLNPLWPGPQPTWSTGLVGCW